MFHFLPHPKLMCFNTYSQLVELCWRQGYGILGLWPSFSWEHAFKMILASPCALKSLLPLSPWHNKSQALRTTDQTLQWSCFPTSMDLWTKITLIPFSCFFHVLGHSNDKNSCHFTKRWHILRIEMKRNINERYSQFSKTHWVWESCSKDQWRSLSVL